MTTVAVMQPTFLPWLGYLDLMDQVDHFVYLDSVQFSKQSWQQRNRIRTEKGLEWMSVPAWRPSLQTPICAVSVAESPAFPSKILGQVEAAYRRAPQREILNPLLARIEATEPGSGLADLTIGLIDDLRSILDIDTPVSRSSELAADGGRSELVIDLVHEVGGTEYLSPPGAADYLAEDLPLYHAAGLPVSFHQYEHPSYPQLHEPFEPYASCIDALAMLGAADARSLMVSGRRSPLPADAQQAAPEPAA